MLHLPSDAESVCPAVSLLCSSRLASARLMGRSSYFQSPPTLGISNGRRWGFDGPGPTHRSTRGVCPVSATSQGNTAPSMREGPRGRGLWLGGRTFRAQLSGRMVCGKRVTYGSSQREHQPLTPVNPHPARRVPAAAGRALGRNRVHAVAERT